MGTFTLTQSQPGQEILLYPSGDGCTTELTPIGAANNWQCVDEIKDAYNEDTDYVVSQATNALKDLYLTDESIVSNLSGTINYIQVYARGKSYLYPQEADGIFKILITTNPSECTDGVIYKSDDKNLITDYSTFSYVWNTNPSTASNWVWADLEDLEIGIEVSSPTITDYLVTATFRPNAAGDKTELQQYPNSGNNYEKVDEATSDGDSTVVWTSDDYGGGVARKDLYNIPNHTTEAGTIQKIAVFYKTSRYPDLPDGEASAGIKTGGTEYWETLHDVNLGLIYTLYSYEWTTNPNTGVAWTWADIDSLQIGVQLKNTDSWIYCTQVYMVVYYYATINPQIRTTQVYAKINYDTSTSCTLNKPQEVSVDHSRNVAMLNFWSGNRAVYDLGRNKKTMVITGKEHGTDACTKMQCIRDMGKFGGELTTSGIGGNFDSTFRILSFGWKKISDLPLVFDWILELEYADLDE